ncbi:aldehyde dehydrogenase family protein [Alcaligenaceae bacterium]|nr:aldehyde dehydrogenase family protein [Alcaligenaceae bacterium]
MKLDHHYTMTIDGAAATSTETFTVINPATEQVIANAPDATHEQVDAAIAAARRAFPGWSTTPLERRQALVRQISERLAEHKTDFAALLTQEQGKPLADAESEIDRCLHWLQETAKLAPPVQVFTDTADKHIETRHVPIGVVAAISPWNFPMTLAIWKIAPALVAGNTLILKPSPFTPLTSLKLGELIRDLLPAGVFSVLSGSDRLGPWLTEHPGIDKIAFTGSTPTGRAIMRSASTTLKRVTLELGGNDPAIILADADIEAWVPRLFWAAYSNNAQFCLASKRMYIHASIYDQFASAFVSYAKKVKVGNGAHAGTQIGPIQNQPQFNRVRQLLQDTHAQGIKFLLGGDVPDSKGYFIPIAIVDNPPDDARVVAEEAFGPVLPLLKFSDENEVVRRANDTIFGLGASVWSKDLDHARQLANRLEAGTVWINTIHELSPTYTFGGHKQSGLGTENGLAGLLEYTNAQTIITNRGAVKSID